MAPQPLAVIDVGTNTVRLLVARLVDGQLLTLDNRTATARLGQGVDASGRLAADRMERAATAVAEFADAARAAGATTILAVATSAVRDAANRDEFVALVKSRSGLSVEVIDGEREAALTFRGALLGRPVGGWQVIADIGGGSTELIVAQDGRIISSRSFQLGSGRLTERCLASDPPTTSELAMARAMAAEVLAGAADAPAAETILVGGTAGALLRLTPRATGDDQLTRSQLEAVLARLLRTPAATFAAAEGIDADRARVLPGGSVIIEALMDRFSIDTVSSSRGGIREGALLERLATGLAGG